MARERVALTDKEEKILVQAQLMGLTTASMVKIGNRLKALERERELRAEVESLASNYTITAIPLGGWRIIDESGLNYTFTGRVVRYGRSGWGHRREVHWNVAIDKPGTRFKIKSALNQHIRISDQYPAKICPEKSKEVFALMQSIKRGTWNNLK